MQIPATTPTSLSAAVYDQWAFTFRTFGDGLADAGTSDVTPVAAVATLSKYRLRSDGVQERSPLLSDTVQVAIPDVYGLAATNPLVAAALAAVQAAVASIAQEQGKI